MATPAQSEVSIPATQLLRQTGGRPVLLYADGEVVAAIVSMADYEIVRREKAARLRDACAAIAADVERAGGIDAATFAELIAE